MAQNNTHSPEHDAGRAESASRSVITAASNKFFPSLLNLIGSIRKFHPELPIFVYDLGLAGPFKAEISSMPAVQICEIPKETAFWRSCYTWKASIFMSPKSSLNLYLDAGNELLRPLDGMFDIIESQGYLAVEQRAPIRDILPSDYAELFGISDQVLEENAITAGIFGFRDSCEPIRRVISKLHAASMAGLCLGFSKMDGWKNKGVNKTWHVRDCKIFRHDTTLLSIFLRTEIDGLAVGKFELFGGSHSKNYPGQYLWNMRMNYDSLDHIDDAHALATDKVAVTASRLAVNAFVFFKNIRLRFKTSLSMIPQDTYSKTFGSELSFMDSFHEYPEHSNVRYYHYNKAHVVAEFIKRNAGKNKAFLDAGAGTGPYSHIASSIFEKVFLFEYDESELARASRNMSGYGHENISLRQADLREIPLDDESVDVSVCSEVLEHIPNEERAAAELYRVTKPGGKLLLSMPNGSSIFYKKVRLSLGDLLAQPIESLPYPDWERIRHVSFDSHKIDAIVEGAGFKILRRTGVNVLPIPTRIREALESRAPRAFAAFVRINRALSRMIPRYGSFYFIEAEKPFTR